MATIYDRYGGFSTIRKVISDFYDKMLDNPQLAPFFEHTDMPKLIDHQTKFIASVTGGPASFSDTHLKRVHDRLGISHSDFRAMAGLLEETLEDHGFEASDVAQVMRELTLREGYIVSSDG